MATVRDMIRKKGGEIFLIAPDATVFEALKLMAEHNVGALLVMRDTTVDGIISERDCVRKVELDEKNVRDTSISDVMTSKVISINADEPLEECMALMLEKSIRHLPVFDGNKLLGLVSVRDVLKEVVDVQQIMLSQLERYITGGR
ncbi:MAG: CBS domain-containing protein [Anaerolineales bacterium]